MLAIKYSSEGEVSHCPKIRIDECDFPFLIFTLGGEYSNYGAGCKRVWEPRKYVAMQNITLKL